MKDALDYDGNQEESERRKREEEEDIEIVIVQYKKMKTGNNIKTLNLLLLLLVLENEGNSLLVIESCLTEVSLHEKPMLASNNTQSLWFPSTQLKTTNV